MSMEDLNNLTKRFNDQYKHVRHDPRKTSSAFVDDWTRRCPICKKHYTIIQMAEFNLMTPCCKVKILS